MFMSLYTSLLLAQFATIYSLDVPCKEKLVGQKCLFDEECAGTSTICRNSRCVCPVGFEAFERSGVAPECRPASDQVGAPCQTDCKPPLLCKGPQGNRKCECWQGKLVSGKCIVDCPGRGEELVGQECVQVSKFGGTCKSDQNCRDPFNVCSKNRCVCAPGTNQRGHVCEPTCPDGLTPQQSCRKMFVNNVDIMQFGERTDSCPTGFMCMTYGKPLIGSCCRVRCPYGQPDTSKSCEAGASQNRKCRPLTHFCHTTDHPGARVSLCCPRPCREPNPLYIAGRCLPEAHVGDWCQFDEQCEAGVTMRCVQKRCICRPGFDVSTTGKFVTCAKKCSPSEVQVGERCVKGVGLNAQCLNDAHCPNYAVCYYGNCRCQNGYQVDRLFQNRCTNPDDPLDTTNFFESVSSLFGGAANSQPIKVQAICK